jgi:hypothetical protein
MATFPIQVEIFNNSITSGVDACNSYSPTLSNPVLFLDSNIAIPAVGDILYYDINLTIPAANTSGSWVYLDYLNFVSTGLAGYAARLNNLGEIIEIFNCTTGNYEFLIGTGDLDPTVACINNLTTVVYTDRQLSDLFLQPATVLYTTANLSPLAVLNGADEWFANSGGTVMKVDSSGLITLGGSCNGDSNILALTGDPSTFFGFDDKDVACGEEASFNLFAATPISALQPGDSLYKDAGLTNPFTTPAGNQWFVDPISGTAYQMLDDTAIILVSNLVRQH